jgi:predicted acylesterase/phospholipase RssA
MSEVVKLDPAARKGRRRSGRRRPDKSALVLGGGGFTGGVYEIGALRALDLLAANSTVNDFDIYVGTSAGSFVGSAIANGITPDEMMRGINRQQPVPFRELQLGMLLSPNLPGYLSAVRRLPGRLAAVAGQVLDDPRNTSLMDILTGLASIAPAGLYSARGIESYLNEILAERDRSNDFRTVRRELYVTATDVDTTDRIVFGEPGWDDVPVSLAVRASTALPVVYEPVEVKGRQLIDGGIRSTTNIDIAVEHGAKFIVVINPLVPYINDFTAEIPTAFGPPSRRITDMGALGVANQVFRMMAHDRLHRAVRQWEKIYPGVDIILIEPELDDELMFGTSIMDYSSRIRIAQHGFESVAIRLAREFETVKEIAARHGIEISERRIRNVMETVEKARSPRSVWRRVLEQAASVTG